MTGGTDDALGGDQEVQSVAKPDFERSQLPQGKELIIGLVTPIGTDAARVAERIRLALSEWHYNSFIIRLSSYLDNNTGKPAPLEYEDHRIKRLIDEGNALGRRLKDTGAMAMVAVSFIQGLRRDRRKRSDVDSDDPSQAGEGDLAAYPLEDRTAYIVHSLKRLGEVGLLRSLYGPQFVLVGCQGSDRERRRSLEARYLSESTQKRRSRIVDELMAEDAKQNDEFGQNVNNCYTRADYFLGSDEEADRLVQLLFGDPAVPVRPAEQAMYAAFMASGTSLSASRKVGAAIVKGRSVVAIGTNDAPTGEQPDVLRGEDFSEKYKQQVVSAIVDDLKSSFKALARVSRGDLSKVVSKGAVADLLEGQRAVHAEAAAIGDLARRGESTAGAELYTTTFPCHLCFKGAIDVGISEIRYIYPYPKSRALEMFPDSSSILKAYEGVAPRYYNRTFIDRDLPRFNPETHEYIEPDRQSHQLWLDHPLKADVIFAQESQILEKLRKAGLGRDTTRTGADKQPDS